MGQVTNGDRVKIHYTGKLEDGHVFDSSQNRAPLDFTVGSQTVMPGIEESIIGMEVGDTKSIEISPEDAFGPRREELVVEVRRNDLPDHVTPAVGQRLQMQQPDGNPIDLIITDMNEKTVTLDANHPLAGQTLLFDLELVEIE